jgi:hypothetical protein
MNAVFAIIFAVATTFSGVAAPVPPVRALSNESIAQVIQFDFGQLGYYMEYNVNVSNPLTVVDNYFETEGYDFVSIPESRTIKNDSGELVAYDYAAEYLAEYDSINDTVMVAVAFMNYYSFCAFSGIDPSANPRPARVENKKFWTVEYTQTITDPFGIYFEGNTCSDIISDLNGLLSPISDISYGYIFAGSRQTSVTNDEMIGMAGSYEYYTELGTATAPLRNREVIIFNVRPNAPVWYALAVIVALLLGAIYFVYLRSVNNHQASDQNNVLQSLPSPESVRE